MASQTTSLTTLYSTVYSGTDERKHQSYASLAFVRGIHRWPANSPNKRPVTRKMFPSCTPPTYRHPFIPTYQSCVGRSIMWIHPSISSPIFWHRGFYHRIFATSLYLFSIYKILVLAFSLVLLTTVFRALTYWMSRNEVATAVSHVSFDRKQRKCHWVVIHFIP